MSPGKWLAELEAEHGRDDHGPTLWFGGTPAPNVTLKQIGGDTYATYSWCECGAAWPCPTRDKIARLRVAVEDAERRREARAQKIEEAAAELETLAAELAHPTYVPIEGAG